MKVRKLPLYLPDLYKKLRVLRVDRHVRNCDDCHAGYLTICDKGRKLVAKCLK